MILTSEKDTLWLRSLASAFFGSHSKSIWSDYKPRLQVPSDAKFSGPPAVEPDERTRLMAGPLDAC